IFNEPEKEGVGRLDDRRILGSDGDEVADVEETPVGRPLGCDLPEGEPVWLRLEQGVEPIERRGVPRRTLCRGQTGSYRRVPGPSAGVVGPQAFDDSPPLPDRKSVV